jgi:hypothetical protein
MKKRSHQIRLIEYALLGFVIKPRWHPPPRQMRFALSPTAFATTARWLMRCFRQKRANAAHLNKRQLLVSLDRGIVRSRAWFARGRSSSVQKSLYQTNADLWIGAFGNLAALCEYLRELPRWRVMETSKT